MDRLDILDGRGLKTDLAGSGLVAVCAVSTLLFGSVEYWSEAITGTLAAAIFIACLFRAGTHVPVPKGVFYSIAALSAYPLFQIVPLPLSVLSRLHPPLAQLVTTRPGATPAFHSVTVYAFPTEMAFAGLVVYLMIFCVAAFNLEGDFAVRRVLKGLSFFGFILALFAIIQYATWNGKLYWFRALSHGGSPFGPFVNKNHFAGFMNMLVPLCLAVSLSSRKTEKKVLYAFFSIVMALTVFLSLSRGGIISFICGLGVFPAILLVRRRSGWQFMVLGFFALGLAGFLLYTGTEPLIKRFSTGEVSFGDRAVVWKGTLSAFRDFPVFGTGLGTFEHVFKLYQPAGLQNIYEHAHNDYLELLLETGIAGVLAAAAFIYVVLWETFRYSSNGKTSYLRAGFICSLLTVAVHSLVDFNLHIPSNAILFFMILGLALASGRASRKTAGKAERGLST